MTVFQFKLMMLLIRLEIILRGYRIDEGASSAEELQYLYNLTRRPNIRIVGEIGFHLGFSSYAFLKANPDLKVISFDIGNHPFVPAAKKIIDRKFPGRHTLIYGDSKQTISEFTKKNPNLRFDIIFIDGGHDKETAESDIDNMQALAHRDTLLVMDDITPWTPWGKGPTEAWREAINDRLIMQDELYKDGKLVTAIAPPGERSWAVGHYLFK